ncbi:MAG: glutathione S-transferase C-terminal domain-containing protein [Treponema sp.]|jgi:putative glutathione S-transferase|nr:glutathione S-transferase C-terminal domain-containing protein [Treponema sp.]
MNAKEKNSKTAKSRGNSGGYHPGTVNGYNPYPEDPHELLKHTLKYETTHNVFAPFTRHFGKEFPVEAGRYRLVLGRGCPFSHRIEIIWKLLGLEKAITAGFVAPPKSPTGWIFTLDPGGIDPVLKIHNLGEAYVKVAPGYAGRASIPSIIDIPSGGVVSCEDLSLGTELESLWKPFHKKDAPDLYPEKLRKKIDALNKILLEVNGLPYDINFSESQKEYDENFDAFFGRLDDFEKTLGKRRYLLGEEITDSDTKLFPTLVRFDVVYYHSFKANRNSLREFPNLWRYTQDLYSIKAFRDSTDFAAIKEGYYLGNLFVEPKILIKGPDLSHWGRRKKKAPKD